MNKDDLFYKLINEGILLSSGLDKHNNSYRVFQFKNKRFRLILKEEVFK